MGWYPDLNETSSFEEFQRLLHERSNPDCPLPCPPSPNIRCHTAQPGEECHRHVSWAMQVGIKNYPERYPSTLSNTSSLEEVQGWLSRMHFGHCLPPFPADAAANTCDDSCVTKFQGLEGCTAFQNDDRELIKEIMQTESLQSCNVAACAHSLFDLCFPEVEEGACDKCSDQFLTGGGCEAMAKSIVEDNPLHLGAVLPAGCLPCGGVALEQCKKSDTAHAQRAMHADLNTAGDGTCPGGVLRSQSEPNADSGKLETSTFKIKWWKAVKWVLKHLVCYLLEQ